MNETKEVILKSIDSVLSLLKDYAKRGAVVGVGNFQDCDPCVAFLALDEDTITSDMERWAKNYDANCGLDNESEPPSTTFGWTVNPLDDENLEELAELLVQDNRLEELENVSRGWTCTIPLP